MILSIPQQYNDTKNTFNEVYNIVSDGFSDSTPKTGKKKPPPKAVITDSNSNSTVSMIALGCLGFYWILTILFSKVSGCFSLNY